MSKAIAKGNGAVVEIRRDTGAPIHREIAGSLRRAIEAGLLAPGARLASTRALAQDWRVSRNTVLQAFEILISEGYAVGRVGAGTYVAEAPPRTTAAALRLVETLRPSEGGYPFRGLSRRGRRLAGGGLSELLERPAPFMPDAPDFREFPMRSWLRLTNEVSGGLTGEALGAMSSAGHFPLRRAIAHHVAATRGLACAAEQVIITTGSQQSLDLCARLMTDVGDTVWMEDPGYVGARAALAANGCAVAGVPVDEEGMDVAAGIDGLPAPKLICVSPARQYPLGVQLSAARRRALLGFAARGGAWIVEDDYDGEMRYDGPPPPALGAGDAAARVILIGTFSKTLLPSLRLGYVVAPADLADSFAAARTAAQGHAPLLEQMTLAEMMHRGLYVAHLRRMRVLYRERQQALADALRERFGFETPAGQLVGGMHLVLPFRAGADDAAAARALAQKGVIARPLSPYAISARPRAGLLLGFAAFRPEEIARAAPLLAAVAPLVAAGAQRS